MPLIEKLLKLPPTRTNFWNTHWHTDIVFGFKINYLNINPKEKFTHKHSYHAKLMTSKSSTK